MAAMSSRAERAEPSPSWNGASRSSRRCRPSRVARVRGCRTRPGSRPRPRTRWSADRRPATHRAVGTLSLNVLAGFCDLVERSPPERHQGGRAALPLGMSAIGSRTGVGADGLSDSPPRSATRDVDCQPVEHTRMPFRLQKAHTCTLGGASSRRVRCQQSVAKVRASGPLHRRAASPSPAHARASMRQTGKTAGSARIRWLITKAESYGRPPGRNSRRRPPESRLVTKRASSSGILTVAPPNWQLPAPERAGEAHPVVLLVSPSGDARASRDSAMLVRDAPGWLGAVGRSRSNGLADRRQSAAW